MIRNEHGKDAARQREKVVTASPTMVLLHINSRIGFYRFKDNINRDTRTSRRDAEECTLLPLAVEFASLPSRAL